MFAKAANLLRIGVAALMLGILGTVVGPVSAQKGLDTAAPSIISMENEYIGVGIGLYGTYKLGPPSFSHYMIDAQPVGGRWQIYTTGGDPLTKQDDNQPLNYGAFFQLATPGDKWGAFQVMVDGMTKPQGSDTAGSTRAWATFERGGKSAILGDVVDGEWRVFPYRPTNRSGVIVGEWYPTIDKGTSSTGVPDVSLTTFPLRCEMEVRLMRDTVRFKWTITNEDYIDHLVGLRTYADVMAEPLDEGTIDMRNVVSVPGRPLVTDRSVLFGKDIPSVLEMFNSQDNPSMSVRVGLNGQGATPPDVLGIDEWVSVAGDGWSYWLGVPDAGGDPMTVWGYEPIPFQDISDLGYGAFWRPRRVVPGGKVTFINYVGLASATSDFTKPNLENPQYVAAAQGPRTLKYSSDVLGIGQLFPIPFSIHAWMLNTEKFNDFQNASFTLTLPEGLTLDDTEAGKYSKSVPTIPAGTEAEVYWKVKPVGRPTGILDYTVSMSAAPVGGTTIRRQINIPATEAQPFMAGWQMISVPFSMDNPDPSSLGLSNATMWRYDAYRREYMAVTRLVPGEAYWLKLSNAQTSTLAAGTFSSLTWRDTQGFQIPMQQGWNLVGNPYVYTTTLGASRFYFRDYGTLSYDEAVSRGLISSTVFWWDPVFRRYSWSSDRAVQIKPWQGYWVRTMRPGVTLILSPAEQIGAAVGGTPTSEDEGGTIDPGGPPSGP